MIRRSYPRERVEDVLITLSMQDAVRIFPVEHIDIPLGVVPNVSRFSPVGSEFAVLYAATDIATAFAEHVIRDRFVGRGKRRLHYMEIRGRAVATLSTRKDAQLQMLELRGDGCMRLGAPTDAVGARNQAAGRALSQAIHQEHTDIDGIVWESRFTGSDVYGIYDRAIGKLRADAAIPLSDHHELATLLKRYDLSLRRWTSTLG